MKFLIDAQLPQRMSERLLNLGHNSLHTLDLPRGNRTPDRELNQLSVAEERVLVTKDTDFVDSLIVQGLPFKLLLVSTGNISNRDLSEIFFRNLAAIIDGFGAHDFIEIDRKTLLFHF